MIAFFESLELSLIALFVIFVSLLMLIFSSASGGSAREKLAAKSRLREAAKAEEFRRNALYSQRHGRLDEISRLIAHTKPHSDEERRLLDLAESMNLNYEEWRYLISCINAYQAYHMPSVEYLPDTRPHIHYRQLRALESEAA